jgi:putative CocE/NonD family hydrolase
MRSLKDKFVAPFSFFVGLLVVLAVGTPLRSQTDVRYGIGETKDVMVAMRDGVKLAADIYHPTQNGQLVDGKFPVILLRTPYNKEDSAQIANSFVPHGYVVVLQDVRGRYKSEGHWRPHFDDPNDGFDTAQWIGSQRWCDGGIGTLGSSYAGATQHALAIGNAPYIKAMVPRNAMSDYGRYGVRHNGAFELRFFNWVFTLGNAAGTPDALPAAKRAATDPAAAKALVDMGDQVREYVRALPLRPGTTPLKFAPDYESWLIEAMSHGDYDDFWKNSGASVVDHLAEYKDVPEYHTTGWYDSWGSQVANMNFVELRRTKKSLQRLIIGPWIHSRENLSYAGEAQFTDDAALDLDAFQLRWFEHWLKDVDNGVDREPPVRIYVMGGGDAHKTPSWEAIGATNRNGRCLAPSPHRTTCMRTVFFRLRSQQKITQSLISSTRVTRCPRSAAMFLRKERSCSKEPPTSAAASISGSAPTQSRSLPEMMCWCSRHLRSPMTSKSLAASS